MTPPAPSETAPFPEGLPLLLAFDLDGTLIRDGGQDLPEDTAAALARLRALGVRTAIVTGRDLPPHGVSSRAEFDAVATNNGGRVHLGEDLRTSARFGPGDLEAVLAHELDGARVVLFTEDDLYVQLPPGRDPEPWMLARQARPLAEAPHAEVTKVGFWHPDVAGFAARLRASHPHLVVTGGQAPYPEFLTITPTGAHKAAALSLIAEALDIPLERTVAFGDSDNDEVMLELAGYAVQVGTLPLLTRHADVQVAGHGELGAYLNAVAERLEQRAALAPS